METAPAGKEAWQEILERALEGDIQQSGRLCQEYLSEKEMAKRLAKALKTDYKVFL